ncbi:hypothetical protein PHYC_03152 [Phycisphaerales bacterium]|nr:hypothetical protein PHYC_03152 [Phycisphaerales bacterium]
MPDAEISTRPGRAWLFGLAGVVLLLIAATAQKVWSIDFWWQLRNGEWICEHRAVPHEEIYSWTAAGTPLREMRWVYCAVIYGVYTHLGAWALTVVQALAVMGTWAAVACPYRRMLLHHLPLLLLAMGIFAGLGRWVMRPELATYFEFALFLTLLTHLRHAGQPRRRWVLIAALAVSQVCWTNLHTLFLFGPVLAWCFVFGDGLQRVIDRARGQASRPAFLSRWLFLAALAVSGACWANPYFHDGAMYVLQMYRETRGEHATNQFIGEMRSPLGIPLGDWTWDLVVAAALGLLAAVIAIATRRRFDVVRTGILLLGLILFAQLQRNAPLLAIAAVWASLGNLSAVGLGSQEPLQRTAKSRLASGTHVALFAACLVTSWFIMTDRIGPRLNQPREFGFGIVEWVLPRGAADFLAANRPVGNLFNTIRDGAYFIWRVRDQKVFIDGRTDAYGPEILKEASTLTGSQWTEWSSRRGINTAVFPIPGFEGLLGAVASSPDWALVFLDHRDAVFLRRVPENSTLIERFAINPERPWTPPATPAPEGARSWKHTIGGVPRARQSEGIAGAWLAMGYPQQAREFLKRGLEVEPGNLRLRMDYAQMLLVDGATDKAARFLEGLPKVRRVAVLRDAAASLIAAGHIERAETPLVRALELSPEDRELLVALADVRFQTNRPDLAAPDYEHAQRLSPTVNEWNKLAAIYAQLNDAARGEHSLRESLRLDPRQPSVWNMLGGILGRQGNLDEARTCFQRALELKPDFKAARDNLDRVRGALSAPPR